MIDKFNYSDDLFFVDINIGGFETKHIQNMVLKEVKKNNQVKSFFIKDLDGCKILSLELPIQVLPIILLNFSKKNLAIYEVTNVIAK